MKKLHLLYIGLLSIGSIYGQDISDAVRYSQSEIQGTARFRALSGAFGALGGDMSAVSANPAGSAVFNQSHMSFTGSNVDAKNNTNYFSNTVNSSTSNFNINQGGAVFVFANNNNATPWQKFTFGIAYENTNNYHNNWFANGLNTNDDGNLSNSISSYFFDFANNPQVPVKLQEISLLPGETKNDAYIDIIDVFGLTHQQAFLGFQSFILDAATNDDDNTEYTSNVNSGNFSHNYAYLETGYNGKISFNFASQYKDNLYLGINLNSHFIDYQRSIEFSETNSNGGTITNIDFDNKIATTGNGFSFQLGGIMKITPQFRAGVTYDSPTWYSIDDETTQFLDTNILVEEDENAIGNQAINIFPRYRLKTPSKITGSLAYIFSKKGLLSFDYSKKDYGNTKFRPNADFSNLNTGIGDVLANAATYRLGGEYKHKQFSFRGGYRFEESPYEDGITIGDLTGYSLGLGYNFGNTRLDLTYDTWEREDATPLFNIGLIDTATINRTNSNITLSLSFNI